MGRRKTQVSILSGSVVRVWGALEGVLSRHEHSLSRSDRTMRAVHVSFPDGESLPLIGETSRVHTVPLSGASCCAASQPGALMQHDACCARQLPNGELLPHIGASQTCRSTCEVCLCQMQPRWPDSKACSAPTAASALCASAFLTGSAPSQAHRRRAGVHYPDKLLPGVVEALQAAQVLATTGKGAAQGQCRL